MKKIFCLLLTLSLLCMGVALADTSITTDGGTGETTLTYPVPEAQTGYTVIIPASVTIPQGGTSPPCRFPSARVPRWNPARP